jgi:ElaB/YqjD/DUF883 family membrane-anchored ribosome-binding protein
MAAELLEKPASVDDVLREVNRLKSVVTDAVEDGVQSALKAVKQGREVAEDAIHDARYAIKRNPFQAVGVVFAVGIAIGSLITLVSYRRD